MDESQLECGREASVCRGYGFGRTTDVNINEDDRSSEVTVGGNNVTAIDGEGSIPHTQLVHVVSRLEDGRQIIGFSKNDPENPYNWSMAQRYWISFLGILQVTNSTFTSAITSGATNYIAEEFDIPNGSLLRTLPISLFLVGYILGPCLMGPLSEYYGRRPVIVTAFLWFLCWGIGCALSPNLPALLTMRFLCGLGASAPLTIVSAIYADIWDNPVFRGRLVAGFCVATSLGPVFAPTISGFVSASHLGWRFSIWASVMLAAITAIPNCFYFPETFGPVILVKKAKRLRKETEDHLIVAPMELDDRKMSHILLRSLATPFEMFCTEAIVGLTSLYLAFVYGTFYLTFQSYPIIFQGNYEFSAGIAGLAFIPMGVGGCLSYPAVLLWDAHIRRRTARQPNNPPSDEYRRLPIACIGGTAFFISLFWLGWSGNDGSVHWIVPMLSGIPFGFGFSLAFIACLNYITDAYEVYSAGGLAANSMVRSVFGVTLPFAAGTMYGNLGVGVATSVLGAAAVVLTGVPLLFLKYGDTIRANSKFGQRLRELKEKERAREERNTLRAQSQVHSTTSVTSAEMPSSHDSTLDEKYTPPLPSPTEERGCEGVGIDGDRELRPIRTITRDIISLRKSLEE